MKKTLALVLAIVMMMALALPAVAADETYTLTINSTVPGHTYEAYQIFTGTLSIDTENNREVLSTIRWGNGVTDGAAVLAAIKAENGLSVLHSATDAESLAKLLGTVSSDSATLDLFASVVGKFLNKNAAKSDDYTDSKYEIAGLAPGYYLIKDKDGSLVDEDGKPLYDSYTKFILRVLKDETVTPKSDVPEVEKKINDTLGGTYTEHEDFDITDMAYYKWDGQLPSNLSAYKKYFYKFYDNLPTGIIFEAIQQVYIEGHDGNVVHTFYDITDDSTANDVLPTGITLKVDGQRVTRQADGSFVHSGTAISDSKSGTVSLEFSDLFALYPRILNTHKIVVKYTALVSRHVVFSEAMINDVYVEYSNNPNDPNGEGHGITTHDEAYAFTFEINVDKYDADNKAKKLEGAEFVLYYTRIEDDADVNYYALVVTEEMIEAGEKINGVALTDDLLGQVYGWTTDETAASILDTDAKGHLRVGGLDEGTYFLKEITPPIGYNLMESPVQIDIIPAYTNGGKDVTVSYQVDSIAQTSNTVGVRNSAGSTLPVTGGIGTTLFYIFGSILVAGAVVLLVTKKRMAAQN